MCKNKSKTLSIIIVISIIVQNLLVFADNNESVNRRIITSQDEYTSFLLIENNVLFIGDVENGTKTKVADNVSDAKFGANMRIVYLTKDKIACQYDRNSKQITRIMDNVVEIYVRDGCSFGWPTYCYFAKKNDATLWGWGDSPNAKKLMNNVNSFKSCCGGTLRKNQGDFVITNDKKIFEIEEVYSNGGYVTEIKEIYSNGIGVSRVSYSDSYGSAMYTNNGEMTYYLTSDGELWGEGYNSKGPYINPVMTEYALKKLAVNVKEINGNYFWDNYNNLYSVKYHTTEFLAANIKIDSIPNEEFYYQSSLFIDENNHIFDTSTKAVIRQNLSVIKLIDNYALTNTGLLYGLAPVFRYDAESDMFYTSDEDWLITKNVSDFTVTGDRGLVYTTYTGELFTINETEVVNKVPDDLWDDDGGYDELETLPLTTSAYVKTKTGYNFNIVCSRELTNEFLCIAIYDDHKRLMQLTYPDYSFGSPYRANFITSEKPAYAKIFIWEDIDNLVPISVVEMVEITE